MNSDQIRVSKCQVHQEQCTNKTRQSESVEHAKFNFLLVSCKTRQIKKIIEIKIRQVSFEKHMVDFITLCVLINVHNTQTYGFSAQSCGCLILRYNMSDHSASLCMLPTINHIKTIKPCYKFKEIFSNLGYWCGCG